MLFKTKWINFMRNIIFALLALATACSSFSGFTNVKYESNKQIGNLYSNVFIDKYAINEILTKFSKDHGKRKFLEMDKKNKLRISEEIILAFNDNSNEAQVYLDEIDFDDNYGFEADFRVINKTQIIQNTSSTIEIGDEVFYYFLLDGQKIIFCFNDFDEYSAYIPNFLNDGKPKKDFGKFFIEKLLDEKERIIYVKF